MKAILIGSGKPTVVVLRKQFLKTQNLLSLRLPLNGNLGHWFDSIEVWVGANWVG